MYDLIFKNISQHISLTSSESDFFASLLIHQTPKRREIIQQTNQMSKHIIFVNKGCLRVYDIDQTGKEHIVFFAPKNWWCGELHGSSSDRKSSFFIDSLKDSDILLLSKTNIEVLCDEIPLFDRFFRILFQNAFYIQQNRIKSFLSLNAVDRYYRFRKTYPNLEKEIPQKYIASYIGVTPEFFSEIKVKKTK
jgi:CRP-like cAMP-binding protein